MNGRNYKVDKSVPLLEYLFTILPGQSRTSVKNALAKGQVLVNGEMQTAFDLPLRKGDSVTILAKGVSIARGTTRSAREEVEKAGVRILFEDANYIVVDKPSGMLTAVSGKERRTLYSILNGYVKTQARMQRKEDIISGREPDRSSVKLWIIHRLDRGVSGAIVFAKNERAKDLLQSKWKEYVAERKCVAWVEGQLEDSPFTVLSRSKRYCEVEFTPEIERIADVREQLAALGHPVAGDADFWAETDPVKRLALHAKTLVFRNPFSGKTVRCVSPLPSCFEIFTQR